MNVSTYFNLSITSMNLISISYIFVISYCIYIIVLSESQKNLLIMNNSHAFIIKITYLKKLKRNKIIKNIFLTFFIF